MFRSREDLLLRGVNWHSRLVLLVLVAAILLGLEQLFQATWLPTAAADLGLAQLEPSDAAAQSLRTFEWARVRLTYLVWGLIAIAAWALFLPMPRTWLRWLRRSFS